MPAYVVGNGSRLTVNSFSTSAAYSRDLQGVLRQPNNIYSATQELLLHAIERRPPSNQPRLTSHLSGSLAGNSLCPRDAQSLAW